MDFEIGDYVFYAENSVGRVCYVKDNIYSVEYLNIGLRELRPGGGSGGVWREGYPKPITDPAIKILCKKHELKRERSLLQHKMNKIDEELDAVELFLDWLE